MSARSDVPSLIASPSSLPAQSLRRPVRAAATLHEQRDVTVHGLRLRYVDVPAQGPEEDSPILLIHGHSSRLEEYEALIPHLSRTRRVLVPDLPGSGYSEKPKDVRYSLALLEDSLLGFLDALEIERAHLGGGSLGGNLVLRLGHREPGRFGKLAAWAPAGSWAEPMHGWALFGKVMRNLRFMFWPSLWVQSRFWYSKSWPGRDKALADVWTYFREVYDEGFHRMYWEVGIDQALTTLFDRAHRIEHPTYLAVGDRDNGLDMHQNVKRLARLLPRARLRVFEGARHSLANEIPEALGTEIDAFLHE
ncbi:MAG: alpha/beta hydrolase [Sandaracinaceae bacterium]|nr:alpha/beta hydrolase [Sandaracinaceae bacterium]